MTSARQGSPWRIRIAEGVVARCNGDTRQLAARSGLDWAPFTAPMEPIEA